MLFKMAKTSCLYYPLTFPKYQAIKYQSCIKYKTGITYHAILRIYNLSTLYPKRRYQEIQQHKSDDHGRQIYLYACNLPCYSRQRFLSGSG